MTKAIATGLTKILDFVLGLKKLPVLDFNNSDDETML